MYHGTTSNNGYSIEKNGICLAKSQELLDFSKGFYTTPNQRFAISTAKRRFTTSQFFQYLRAEIEGIAVVVLEYNEAGAAHSLRTKDFTEPSNKWARFIAANRLDGSPDLWEQYDNNRHQQYDVVSGPTADGGESLQTMLRSLKDKTLKIRDVKATMCLPSTSTNWGTQVSFHTSKALNYLKIRDILYISWKED